METKGEAIEPTAGQQKTADPETKRALQDFRARGDGARPYTLEDLARLLGSNVATLSRYLSDKAGTQLVGDIPRLEAVARDVMAAATRRAARVAAPTFGTPAVDQIRTVLETIRKTGDVGLIHGPAGIGKSKALEVYLEANPSAIGIVANSWSRSGCDAARLVFDTLDTRKWSGNVKRAIWLIDRLRNSERLLIVDNAHRLSASGLAWLFDFHDETRCPLALVGNPEVLDQIKKNDQQFSRVGLLREVSLGRREGDRQKALDAIAAHMCRRHLGEDGDDIRDLCVRVLGERGHLRALDKHLRLVVEMLPHFKGDLREAFKSAHTQVVSDCRLD
jgi:DNA transposition AAA+ family ATPase